MLHTPLIASALVAGLVAATAVSAQSTVKNATFLSRFQPTGDRFVDCWGFVAADGREFAALAGQAGTYIVDCSRPASPRQTGFIPGPSSPWRDMESYGDHLYIGTDGGPGVQIVDISNPDAPALVTTWGTSIWGNVHNLTIDRSTGLLYAAQTNVGMPVVDLSTNPSNPTLVSVVGESVHNLHVQDGLAHVAAFPDGATFYRILDVSVPTAIKLVGLSPLSNAHNVWVSRDNKVAVTSSEIAGGGMTVFDVSNKARPQQVGFWGIASPASVHDVYLRDRVAHASWYSEGYRALDVTDPTAPLLVAGFDTSSFSSRLLVGAWGCYPFQPSGVVYVSDMETGLWLIETPATTRTYGSATAGVRGEPEIHTHGAPYVGNPRFAVQLEHAAPRTAALLLVGVASAALPFRGLNLNVDLLQPFVSASVVTDADGNAAVPFTFARVGAGARFYAQWVVADAAAPGGLAGTPGLALTTFNP